MSQENNFLSGRTIKEIILLEENLWLNGVKLNIGGYMTDFLLVALIILAIINLLFIVRNKPSFPNELLTIANNIENLEKSIHNAEISIKNEFSISRDENYKQHKDQREELSGIVKNFGDATSNRIFDLSTTQKGQLEIFSGQLQNLIKSNEDKLDKLTSSINDNLGEFRKKTESTQKEFKEEVSSLLKDITSASEKINDNIDSKLTKMNESLNQTVKENREELSGALKSFSNQLSEDNKESNRIIKDKFDELVKEQKELNDSILLILDRTRNTIEEKLQTILSENSKKLDEMRATVDEKLQSTLEKRLSESFKIVSERLEQVHKGLGEMQSLATGVGDLKKVLTNVKARGVLGEYQLENLLDQLLTPDQYSKNVKTKDDSGGCVEFAVKLPGREDPSKVVWLPIDSKFPTEDYHALNAAFESGDLLLIEETKKALCNRIRNCAKDIRDKYINPPNTTDFAIMFLPFEGLYAEALRNIGLFESIQRDYKVTFTGPTTLAAFLNSLQMGFRTLAIEKRSSEVWEILGAVKTEFGYFGEVLKKTQKKLQEASNVIDQAGTRSRVIQRKLRDVHELPKDDSIKLLGDDFEVSELEQEISESTEEK